MRRFLWERDYPRDSTRSCERPDRRAHFRSADVQTSGNLATV